VPQACPAARRCVSALRLCNGIPSRRSASGLASRLLASGFGVAPRHRRRGERNGTMSIIEASMLINALAQLVVALVTAARAWRDR